MPALEDLPRDEKVRRGNVLLKTRPRDVEETLLQLINDEDEVVAAAAELRYLVLPERPAGTEI